MIRASAGTASSPAASAATRQPEWAAMPVRKTGARAQPRLPDRPCTEKAWPSRGADTLRLRMVKSQGWKTLLPSPARAATTISPAKEPAWDSSTPAATKQLMPAASTRTGPKRSTASPDRACPTPETRKKTVMVLPMPTKSRPNSGISHGKRGGSRR